jgi:AcrR family transcriptional regulator
VSRDDAAAEQRRRILRVTAQLVAKRGYQDTTTELIVRRAKVGYRTFYKFFKDKETCFLALYDETLERTDSILKAAYASGDPDTPWSSRVAAAIDALYRQIVEDPALARACLVESITAGPAVLSRYEGAIHRLCRILEPGRRESEIGGELPDTLENTLAGGILWIAYQLLIVGETSRLPDLLPEAIQFALSPYLGEEKAVAAAESHLAVASAQAS